jgi:hypothetical protein
MTVRELIRQLQTCDPDADVYFEGQLEDDPAFLCEGVVKDATAIWPKSDLVDDHHWERDPNRQERAEGVVMLRDY